jgi:hypothetical protein
MSRTSANSLVVTRPRFESVNLVVLTVSRPLPVYPD